MGHGRRLLGALILAGLLGGCAPRIRDYGYAPSQSELSGIVVGADTKDRVAEVIGYPSMQGMTQDDAWYYVAARQETIAFKAPKVTEREIVEVSFNKDGTVRNISRYGLKDGRVIVLNRRVTDSSTKGISFLRQAFANLGRLGTPSGPPSNNPLTPSGGQ